MFDVAFAESRLAHPRGAIGARVVEATRRLDQHVQAHQKSESIFASIVIYDRLENDQRATLGECLVGLTEQHLFFLEVPVVQDVAHHKNVCRRQWVLEEVARVEAQPVTKAMRVDVFLEGRADGRQIEPAARKMVVGQRNLYRQSALGRPEGSRDLFLIRDNCIYCGCSPLFKNTCKFLLFTSMVVLHVHCCSGALSSNCRQSSDLRRCYFGPPPMEQLR